MITDKIKKIWTHSAAYIFLFILSVLLGCCTLAMTAIPVDIKLIRILLNDSTILIMNVWPLLASMILLYFITSRAWISFLGTGLVAFAIAEVYRFKMFFRDDPFVFEDLLLVNEAKDMIGKYELFLDKISLFTLLFIVIATVLCFFFVPKKLLNIKVRLAGVFLSLVILTTSINHFYFNNSTLYAQTWHYEFGNQWKEGNQYMSRGVIYSFIRSIPNAFITPPDDYNKAEMEALLNEYTDTNIPEDKKVHIISIMLEAYNDFSQFDGIEFVTDPYVNFHELQKEAYYGNLFTNIFAANTITTERSFLTGYDNIRFRDKGTESFVRYFKSQGYYTEAMHPCFGWFYDRQNINYNLGFDNFDYQENAYADIDYTKLERPLYHELLSDYDFFKYIIKGYEDTVAKDDWYFNFSVTYQNHGPYYNGVETDVEYLKKKEEYSESEYNIMNNYLRGIASTDEALKLLRDYIDSQEEPIVLILFGDHNPWGGDGNSVYSMLNIDLNLGTVEGAQNYYQTPYLIYANEAAKQKTGKTFVAEGNTVSPMFLMCEFFKYIDWKGPAYMGYLQDLHEEHSVINTVFIKDGDTYVPRTELADDEWLKNHKSLEYYMKYDK